MSPEYRLAGVRICCKKKNEVKINQTSNVCVYVYTVMNILEFSKTTYIRGEKEDTETKNIYTVMRPKSSIL